MRAMIDPAPCAPWCSDLGHGWDVTPFATVKTCEATNPAGDDADGRPIVITIERFTSLDDGSVSIGPTMLRLHCEGLLTLTGAHALADALIAAAGTAADEATAA